MANNPILVVDPQNGNHAASGNLFAGLKFFILQRVPLRSDLVSKVTSNGGSVVRHEEAADYIVADHVRRDSPAGSISWTFIDSSFRAKKLQDPEMHRIGVREGLMTRVIGSGVPGKNTRTQFTADDDRVLWDWVESARLQGAPVRGNEIYKQLEARNPRHTFQAWRDRYIKKLVDQPPPAGASVAVVPDAKPTPPPTPRKNGEEVESMPLGPMEVPPGSVQEQTRSEGHVSEHDRGKRLDGSQVAAKVTREASSDRRERGGDPQNASVARDPRPLKRQEADAASAKAPGASVGQPSRSPNPPDLSTMDEQQGDDTLGNITPTANDRPAMKHKDETETSPSVRPSQPHDRLKRHATVDAHTPRLALTEANLATQQAQHKSKSLRGMDLLEDDPNADQSDYVEFLSSALSGKGRVNGLPISGPARTSDLSTPRTGLNVPKHGSPSRTASGDRSEMPRAYMAQASLRRLDTKGTRKRSRTPTSPVSVDAVVQAKKATYSPAINRSEDHVVDEQNREQDDVDLTIPSPEGGWGFDSSQDEVKNSGAESHSVPPPWQQAAPDSFITQKRNAHQSHIRGRAVETQDIVNAETQDPDLSMPLPPDSDEEFEHEGQQALPADPVVLSPLQYRETKKAPIETAPVEDLQSWAATMRGRGYTPLSIINALQVSSARTDLAELVLLEERSGRGLPKDVPGIWSESEDLTLESGNAKGLRFLERKHGWEECRARLRHLTERRAE